MFLHVPHICFTAAEIPVHQERLIFHALFSEPYCLLLLYVLWRRDLPTLSIFCFVLFISMFLHEFVVEVFGPLSFLFVYLFEIPLPPQRPYSQYLLELRIILEYVIQVFVLYAENIRGLAHFILQICVDEFVYKLISDIENVRYVSEVAAGSQSQQFS